MLILKYSSLKMPLLTLCIFGLIALLLAEDVSALNISYEPPNPQVFVDESTQVQVVFQGTQSEVFQNSNWSLSYEPYRNLEVELVNSSMNCDDSNCTLNVSITGRFLGFGSVTLWRQDKDSAPEKQDPSLQVTILRQNKVINHVFTAFVATVVTINYINMGCALELEVVKSVLRRPIGPVVGFVCQFLIMPLVSLGVGQWLFDDPVLRLGLFTFGSSPGGGASNMWTVLLGGNLNLSITMTFVSTLAALGTIPLWLFTLGKTIVKGTNIVIPYANILISLVSLMVPLGIGICIQRKFPKVAARSKRLLAPICIILLIGIIIMASIANSYMFFMLTWRMVIAASLSVWAGFAMGVIVSLFFRFPRADVVAIAVETGIQNSGIAFLLLSYSLKAPVSDMASVVPVAASIITPIPLFIIFCYQKIRNCCSRRENFKLNTSKERLSKTKSTSEGHDLDLNDMK